MDIANRVNISATSVLKLIAEYRESGTNYMPDEH